MITDTLESIRPHLRYLRWMPASRGPLVLAAQFPSWPPIFGPGAHALVWRLSFAGKVSRRTHARRR